MLEEKDFLTIGSLLDQKLKKNNKILKDEIVDEITGVVNDAFGEFEGKVNKRVDGLEDKITELDKKVDLRPTLNQIMNWGDKKIVALELAMDKVKYLHQEEFNKLPPQAEISRRLVECGLKEKTAHPVK